MRWTPPAISTSGYEATPTFSPDGGTMIYLAADAAFRQYQLAESRCADGGWSAPRPLPFGRALPVFDADPFLTPDGQSLYFISTRHDPKNEDFDIYVTARGADGEWGEARRLPAPVNSPGSELLPRMDLEGRLYFGSDRPGGHGGGDIYVATPAADGWRVSNVGAPVNTSAFEYEAEISQDGREMVVVADRTGRSHLYRYQFENGAWRSKGAIRAMPDQFQVGPLLSPTRDRILFAQRDGELSGEMFVMDLAANPDRSWPPSCP